MSTSLTLAFDFYFDIYYLILGAGPGAGFTFHGGGHGGVGGGSWIDTSENVSYGKSYETLEHLVGGSSGQF